MIGRSGKDAVEPPVLIDQLCCSLFSHSGHPRQIVRRVASQGRVLHVLLGSDPRAFKNPCFVVERIIRDSAFVVEHTDMWIVDELIAIAIPRHNDHVSALGLGPHGKRRNHIVSLKTRLGHDWQL